MGTTRNTPNRNFVERAKYSANGKDLDDLSKLDDTFESLLPNIATDLIKNDDGSFQLEHDTTPIGNKVSINWDDIKSKPDSYHLPVATNTTLGGVKIDGNYGINIATTGSNAGLIRINLGKGLHLDSSKNIEINAAGNGGLFFNDDGTITLKKASSNQFGCILANSATAADTQEIHINNGGFLVTTPSTGSQGPKGDKGDKGDKGPKGDKGDPGTTYTLPVATANKLGGVKIGNGISVTSDGTISISSSSSSTSKTATLFGNYSISVPSDSATTNIDLHEHQFKITHTSGNTTETWLTNLIYSSKSLGNVDGKSSFTKLKDTINSEGKLTSIPVYKEDAGKPVTGYLSFDNMTIYYMDGSTQASVNVSTYDIIDVDVTI